MRSIKGLGMTTDSQLLELANRMGLPQINYIGFAEDLRRINNGLTIINLGDDFIGGTHWTIFWADNDNLVYFDSYGAPPEDNILRYAGNRTVSYNEKQVQGYHEEFCGVWVLLAGLAMYEGYKKNKDPAGALKAFIDSYHST